MFVRVRDGPPCAGSRHTHVRYKCMLAWEYCLARSSARAVFEGCRVFGSLRKLCDAAGLIITSQHPV